jgi:tRNA pseudouridine55 synthase
MEQAMWHGILAVNKERGLTSHQVVARLRRILNQKEIGHTGTLDPNATGVLVTGLGQATRSLNFLHDERKRYRAEIILGQATDTQDASGAVISEKTDFSIGSSQLESTIRQFIGEIRQIPPMYSAVKVGGQKLYDLARQGIEISRDAREIKVFHWQVLNGEPNYGFKSSIHCDIICSKGTYIRTLIHDLGSLLGCGAHMGKLVRLQSGDFQLEDAHTLDEITGYYTQGRLNELLISMNTALHHLFPIWLTDEDLPKVLNGGKISFEKYSGDVSPGDFGKVLDRFSNLIAVVQLTDAGTHCFWQPVKVFRY